MAESKTTIVRWEVEVTDNKDISPERAAFDALRVMSKDDKPLTFSVLSYSQEGKDRRDINLEQYAVCDNCGDLIFLGDEPFRYAEIKDMNQRIDAGEMVPSCDCPQCGALAYPASKMIRRKD